MNGSRTMAAVVVVVSAHVVFGAVLGSQIVQWRKNSNSNNNNKNNKDEDNDDGDSLRPLRPPLSIAEFEKEAKRHHMSRLAKAYFGYYDGEAVTAKTAREIYKSIRLLPKILVGDLSNVDPTLNIFGATLSMPVLVAPTAFHIIACPEEAEIAMARGAGSAGAGYCYNWMLASRGYEEVTKEEGVKWLHLYMTEKREMVEQSIRLAESTGAFSAIVLTCDHPHDRVQNRILAEFSQLTFPEDQRDRPFMPNHVAVGGPHRTMGDVQRSAEQRSRDAVARSGLDSKDKQSDQTKQSSSSSSSNSKVSSENLSWDDVKWLKSFTKLPVVAKGVLSVSDALIAMEVGVDAIVVSNHGGRQFDGAPPAIEVLPAITAAVAGKIPVFVDTGVRTSTDIAKALCLGATGVLLGRPTLWALSCEGSAGVKRMLDTLRLDLIADMMSLGVRSLDELNPSLIWPPDRERIEALVKSCGVKSSLFSTSIPQ